MTEALLSQIELLPCPFCGGPARIREDAKGGIIGCFPLGNMKPESDCDRNVTLYIGFSARRGDGFRRSRYNKSDAIAAWNRRAPFPGNALPGGAAVRALPAPEPPDADTLAMAKFIYGWWPGLEDDIDWSDSDAHPAYQAAKRIMERGTAAPAPPDPKEPQC